jgi:hypothetical protein
MACVICTHELDPFDPQVISLVISPDSQRPDDDLPSTVYAHLECFQQRVRQHPECVRPTVVVIPQLPSAPAPLQPPARFSLAFDIESDGEFQPRVVLYEQQ